MSEAGHRPLLAEKHYDDGAQDIPSDFSDSGADDDTIAPRPTDRGILDESEQHERLLHKPGRFDGVKRMFNTDGEDRGRRRILRRGRQLKEQAQGSGSAELMYEMEGGYKDTSSRSSSESVDSIRKVKRAPTTRSYLRFLLIGGIIIAILLLLGIGAYKASPRAVSRRTFTNGTHAFGATTILISLDGFRADFLQRDLTPAMSAFIASGVSPKYMMPSFPSLTFPNHYTLVTGLYPESHGIVSNQFWDPHMEEEFWYTNTSNSMRSKWWSAAEPIWNTAEKQGVKTAIHMWPGSEAHISGMDPTYLDRYKRLESLNIKVDRILHWLDMPEDDRPQLIAAYVPNVDTDGHRYGPNSTEIRETITQVDSMLTYLVEELYVRNLTEIVNIVIVSDHGMATTSNDRLVQLDDIIDMSLVDHTDGWPLKGLRLKNPERDVPLLYEQLLTASRAGSFDVYNMETMPERYHFTNNDRIAPLWIVPKPGWVVVEKAEFNIAEATASGTRYSPMGLHGYDHEHPLMRAIFIARGPAFSHEPNSRLAPFQNIEVYNIVCDSLGIVPHANNGTLHLPLTPEGLHSDFEDQIETPADPVEESSATTTSSIIAATKTSTIAETSTLTSAITSAVESLTSSTAQSSTLSAPPQPTPQPSETPDPDSDDKPKSDWWQFLHDQIEKAKDWAKQMLDNLKNNKPETADEQPV